MTPKKRAALRAALDHEPVLSMLSGDQITKVQRTVEQAIGDPPSVGVKVAAEVFVAIVLAGLAGLVALLWSVVL